MAPTARPGTGRSAEFADNGGSVLVEGARVTKSTDTVLAASTPTVLTWDTVINNSNGVYNVGQPTRLTAITGGWYVVSGSISWNTTAYTTTMWRLQARKNGSLIIGQDRFDSTAAFAYSVFPQENKISEVVYLNASDYIELIAETTEPSNRNTISALTQYSPLFELAPLGTVSGGSGGSGGGIVADAIFTGGTVSPGGAMADVPDGIGFVEIIYAVPANGTYFFDAWGMAQYGGTFPSDGGFEWSCSVNTVDQGYAFPGPFAYTNVSNSVIRGPMNVRMPLSLLAGVNTIRLRYREVGGLPASALFKVATSPVSLALIKRP